MTQTTRDLEIARTSTTLLRNRAIKHANIVIVHRIACWLVHCVIGIGYIQDIADIAFLLEAGIPEGAIVRTRQRAERGAAVVLGIEGAAVEGHVVAVADSHLAHAGAETGIFHPHSDASEGDVAGVVEPGAGVLQADVLHRGAGAVRVDDEGVAGVFARPFSLQ